MELFVEHGSSTTVDEPTHSANDLQLFVALHFASASSKQLAALLQGASPKSPAQLQWPEAQPVFAMPGPERARVSRRRSARLRGTEEAHSGPGKPSSLQARAAWAARRRRRWRGGPPPRAWPWFLS